MHRAKPSLISPYPSSHPLNVGFVLKEHFSTYDSSLGKVLIKNVHATITLGSVMQLFSFPSFNSRATDFLFVNRTPSDDQQNPINILMLSDHQSDVNHWSRQEKIPDFSASVCVLYQLTWFVPGVKLSIFRSNRLSEDHLEAIAERE